MKAKMFDLKVENKELKKDLNKAFNKLLMHGQFFLGPEVEIFEKKTAEIVGKKYAVGVDSGSSALYLSLKACGIGPGDEVITTPLTWIITTHAIYKCGAKPVFVDVGDDFNINPSLISKKINLKTKAIVPMHYAGHMCDMNEISQIAKKNNLIIVEDAAQAFGARLNNKKAGSFSKAAAFSMNPMKPLAGYGEGGLAVTDDKNIYEKLKILRHAATTSDPKKIITNYCVDVSLNHKMDSLNAALLLVALKYFPKKIEKRNEIAKKYMNGLNNKIKFQKSHFGEKHGRFVFPIIVDKRDELKKYLEKKNIETKIFNVPLVPETPVYSKYNLNDTPNAKKLLNSSLVIPSHEKMKIDEVDYVIDKINNFMHINL